MKAEDVVSDIRDMRKAIYHAAYSGKLLIEADTSYRFPSPCESMARAILNKGEYEGLSGDDTMTFLAYEMMKMAEQLYQKNLEMVMTEVRPMQFVLPNGTELISPPKED